jgi:hypothetical protein
MKTISKKILLFECLIVTVLSMGWIYKSNPNSSYESKIYSSPKDTSKQKQPQYEGDKPAEEVFKNIKVLKGMPAWQLQPTMHFIEASVGMNCGNCHVRDNEKGWEFDKDTKPEKRKAREMIKMMDAINTNSFKGHQEVTCFTCHHGNPDPEKIPNVTTVALMQERQTEHQNEDKEIYVQNRLNTAKQIIDKYIQALGGKEAIGKITSLKLEGSSNNGKNELITYWKAPNFYYSEAKGMRGEFVSTFNGSSGWLKMGQYTRPAEGVDLQNLKLASLFFSPLDIEKYYSGLKLDDVQLIGSDTVYIVDGTISKYRSIKLYFNTNTGLLERQIVFDQTPLGSLQVQTDFRNYQKVNGVLFPFETIESDFENVQDVKYRSIKANVHVEENLFETPAK